MKGEPFVSTHTDVLVDFKFVSVFNDIGVLYAITVAGAHNSADVLRLIKVFQQNRDVAGSVSENFQYAGLPLFGDKLGKMFYEFLPEYGICYFLHIYA